MRLHLAILPILLLTAPLVVVGETRSADPPGKLPTNMTEAEKKAIAVLENAVQTARSDIEKHGAKLVAYFTADYPNVSSRLEGAGMPGQSAGVPGGTKFQPGFDGSRFAQELQQNAAKQRRAHREANDALQPLIKARKYEVEKKIKLFEEEKEKSQVKTKVRLKKIEVEVAKQYLKEALPICEKWADSDYRKEKNVLAAKLKAAEKVLKRKSEAVIKAHPDLSE